MEVSLYLENLLLSVTSNFGGGAAEMTKPAVVLRTALYSYIFSKRL